MQCLQHNITRPKSTDVAGNVSKYM